MLTLSQADMIHAAILSNFLYGALLMARAPARLAIDATSALWVAATGAVGHICYATMLPDGEQPDGNSARLLMLDIVLVFASLWVFVLTFPLVAHFLVDSAGGLIGL